MAIVISGTEITFDDATTQGTAATAGTSLGSVQFTAYGEMTLQIGQNLSTSVSTGWVDIGDRGQKGGPSQAGSSAFFVMPLPDPTNSVICGFEYYRSGTSTGGDTQIDAGIIQQRAVYRTIS
jgi:hypothetical protein